MNIKKTVTGNTAVMEIEGWLNTQTASELGEALETLESNVTELIIDMSALEYISSSGLRKIVKVFNPLEYVSDKTFEELDDGGMGISMIKQAADNVSYEYKNGRNILTLDFYGESE